MSYVSPVQSSDTKNLLPIIEDINDRKINALNSAENDLPDLTYIIEQRERSRQNALQYKKKIQYTKANTGYSFWGMVAIFMLAPFLVSPFVPSGETVWDLKSKGYSKKWKQRLALMTIGTITWNVLFYFFK